MSFFAPIHQENMVHFTNWVALAVFVSDVSTASFRTGQAPLSQPQTFIQKSIFGQRRDVVIDSHDDFTMNDDFNENTPYEDIATFAHLNWTNCFSPDNDGVFDIGIVGAPFDLGVTYRPGARFGPSGARMGARRLAPSMGYRLVTVFGGLSENMFAYKKYSMVHGVNLFRDWAEIVDCGDIRNTPFAKLQAIHELEQAWKQITARQPRNTDKGDHVRLISIGGDHTISKLITRA